VVLIYEIDQLIADVRQQIINLTGCVTAAIYPQAQAWRTSVGIEGFPISYLPQHLLPVVSVKNNGQFLRVSSVKIY
jgi:hypothetical protein